MELIDAIRERRSVRKFKDTPIPDNVLSEMLDSARMAPSGGNAQGYYFGVIKDTTIKEQLAHAAGNQMWIATAPIVIAGCADISWDIADQCEEDFGLIVNKLRFGDQFIKDMCDYPNRKACMTLFDNSVPLIPLEHIFLTAVSHGLSACFIGYLDIVKANEILKLPSNISCLFLLPVGYADELPSEKYLKSLNDIVFYNKWEMINVNPTSI